jgi:hypothetical protein
MGKQRKLTAGEIALGRAAFGDKIDYKKVKLTDGPGMDAFAHIAFAKGNPAITIDSSIYFKEDYCPDFAAAGLKGRKSFIHEMTHVWQYQTLGLAAFAARYGVEFAKAKGKPNDMYRYDQGKTKFGGAMLEAQANMVGDYSAALWSPASAAQAALLAKLAVNMAGSGLYGL